MQKGYLFIVGCLLFMSNNLMAQDKSINYEFQTGMTLSTLKDKLNTSDWGMGFYSKGLVNFKIKPYFSIATGLGYRYEQFNLKYGTTLYTHEGYVFNEHGEGNIRRHWLDLPILFKGHIKIAPNNRIDIFAGPNFSILTGGKIKDLETGGIYKINPDKFSDRFDYGLNMGLSYMFRERWSVNASYTLGLRKEPPVNELSYTTRSLTLGIGYKF